MGRKSKNSFVIQGSILAFAGILVRIIGLIYRIPLTRILGDEGNGYYSTAYDIYNVLILLSSQSMPLAVSKIVSEKLERRQYKNAYKIFKGALFYGAVLGVSFGLFAFLGADWLAFMSGIIFSRFMVSVSFSISFVTMPRLFSIPSASPLIKSGIHDS